MSQQNITSNIKKSIKNCEFVSLSSTSNDDKLTLSLKNANNIKFKLSIPPAGRKKPYHIHYDTTFSFEHKGYKKMFEDINTDIRNGLGFSRVEEAIKFIDDRIKYYNKKSDLRTPSKQTTPSKPKSPKLVECLKPTADNKIERTLFDEDYYELPPKNKLASSVKIEEYFSGSGEDDSADDNVSESDEKEQFVITSPQQYFKTNIDKTPGTIRKAGLKPDKNTFVFGKIADTVKSVSPKSKLYSPNKNAEPKLEFPSGLKIPSPNYSPVKIDIVDIIHSEINTIPTKEDNVEMLPIQETKIESLPKLNFMQEMDNLYSLKYENSINTDEYFLGVEDYTKLTDENIYFIVRNLFENRLNNVQESIPDNSPRESLISIFDKELEYCKTNNLIVDNDEFEEYKKYISELFLSTHDHHSEMESIGNLSWRINTDKFKIDIVFPALYENPIIYIAGPKVNGDNIISDQKLEYIQIVALANNLTNLDHSSEYNEKEIYSLIYNKLLSKKGLVTAGYKFYKKYVESKLNQ